MVPGGVERWVPVVVVSIAALPLGVLAAITLARLRVGRGTAVGEARRRSLAEVGLVAGTLPWVWMVLTPLPAPRELRLVPLVDIVELLAGAPVTAFFQIVGNLLVFAAFGFFAPLRWAIGPAGVAAVAAVASVIVESLQFAPAIGRVSSVDDVLLNAAGAGLAAFAGRRVVRPPTASARRASVNDRSGPI